MENYLPLLTQTALFEDIDGAETSSLLNCMSYRLQTYGAKSVILREGDTLCCIGLILKGSAHIVLDDFWGNRSIVSKVSEGDLFGEAFAFIDKELNVTVTAAEDTAVLFLNADRINTVCAETCTFHNRLIKNLLKITAEKNFDLTAKMQCLTRRTTRDKLLTYLSEESKRQNKTDFSIPFNRQQLADFLSVDRSAMSTELSKMQNESIISYDKNHFTLKKPR